MSCKTPSGRFVICLVCLTAWAVPCMAARDIQPLVQDSLAQAILIPDDDGRGVLPPGVVLDRTAWEDGLAEIDLTLPSEMAGWVLQPAQAERLQELLSAGLWEDPAFRGLLIRVRIGPDREYLPLETYLPAMSVPAPDAEPVDVTAAPLAGEFAAPGRAPALRSPDLGQQPTGALSGVTVFAAAGHGWTAGSSTWYLQRPLLLNMIEDYGNLEQLTQLSQTFAIFAVAAALAWSRRAIFSANGCSADLPH